MGEKLQSQIEPEVWDKEEPAQEAEELFPEASHERRSSKLITELFLRADEGDDDAFDRLVFLYASSAEPLVAKYLEKAQDPHDLTQESYAIISETIRAALEQGEKKGLTQAISNNLNRKLSKYQETLIKVPTERLDALSQQIAEKEVAAQGIRAEYSALKAELDEIKKDSLGKLVILLAEQHPGFDRQIQEGAKKEDQLDKLLHRHFNNMDKAREAEKESRLKAFFKASEAHHRASTSKFKVVGARKDLIDFKNDFLERFRGFPNDVKFQEAKIILDDFSKLVKELEEKEKELIKLGVREPHILFEDYELARSGIYKPMTEEPLDVDEVEIASQERFEDLVHDKDYLAKLISLTGDKLSKRELEILQARCNPSGNVRTYQDLGVVFGVSRERVRQIENTALGKLRRTYRQMSLREK